MTRRAGPEFRVRVGARIRQRRQAAGLSQNGLARKLPGNIDGSTVSRWELGKSWPTYPNLRALAKVFGISEEELIAGHVSGPDTVDPTPPQRRRTSLRTR
jgi:transcriptional regulator with XRE-family HTH domain